MTTNNPNTLPAREAAKALGLASSTLAKLRLNGNGPVYCKLGRRVVYRTEDLEAWLETRVARDTSDADTRLPKTLTGQQPSSPGEGTAHERATTLRRSWRRHIVVSTAVAAAMRRSRPPEIEG